MRYREIIVESLTDPLPVIWDVQKSNYWFGTFHAGEEYFVSIEEQNDFPDPDNPKINAPWFDLSFGITRDSFAGSRVLNTGMAFRIFATAIASFELFINEVRPEFIMLSASKENNNRFDLYLRMAQRFSSKLQSLGYSSIEPPEHRYTQTAKYFDTLAWRKS